MSLFNINISKLISDLLPPKKREVNLIAFIKGLFSKQDNDNLNLLETIDNTTSTAYLVGTYNLFDRVVFEREVYESLIDNNNDLPNVQTSWIKVITNFIGTNETQQYTTSAIHLEYALNRYFENMPGSIYEYSNGAINLTLLQTLPITFLVGYTELQSSNVNFTEIGQVEQQYVTYDESIGTSQPLFQINVPTSTATNLGANYELIIRKFADKYIATSINYTIELY